MTAVLGRIDCPTCPSRDVGQAHLTECAERTAAIATTIAYAATLSAPPTEVQIRDLIGHAAGRSGSWSDAGAITRCALDLGWRPTVGTPGP